MKQDNKIEQIKIIFYNEKTGGQEQLVYLYSMDNPPPKVKEMLRHLEALGSSIAREGYAIDETGERKRVYLHTPELELKMLMEYTLAATTHKRHVPPPEEDGALNVLAIKYAFAPRGSKEKLCREFFEEVWLKLEVPKADLEKRLKVWRQKLEKGELTKELFDLEAGEINKTVYKNFYRQVQKRARRYQPTKTRKTEAEIAAAILEAKRLFIDEPERQAELRRLLESLGIKFHEWHRSEKDDNREEGL